MHHARSVRPPLVLSLLALCLAVFPARAGNGNAVPDDSMDYRDAVDALQLSAGLFTSFNPYDTAAADVAPTGGDRHVTLLDAVSILRMAAGTDLAPILHPLRSYGHVTVGGPAEATIPVVGGYVIAGRVDVPLGKTAPTGYALREVSDAPSGPVDVIPSEGITPRFYAPAGNYQPIALYERYIPTPDGSMVIERAPAPMGPPLDIKGSQVRLSWAYPPPPPVPVPVPFTYEVKNVPEGASVGLHLETPDREPGDGATLTATFGHGPAQTTYALPGRYEAHLGLTFPIDTYRSNGLGFVYPEVLGMDAPTARIYELPPMGSVEGTITDTARGRLDDVEFTGSVGDAEVAGSVSPDYLGHYAFVAPVGFYVLRVRMEPDAHGTRTFEVPVTVEAAPRRQDIIVPDLPPLKPITVRLAAPPGSVGRPYVVYASPEPTAPPPPQGRVILSASSSDPVDGRYMLYLPDGAYRLTVAP